MIDRLALLAPHEPGAVRSERVRARCHAVLAGERRRQGPAPVRSRPRWRVALEPAIVGCLCAGYLLEVFSRALRLYRF